jgi:Zn-dependent protease with chaperone function
MSQWILYSVIRIGLFALSFAILMALNIIWWASALLATLIAFSISYIFFVRQRDRLADDLAARVGRKGTKDADALAEDADSSEGDGGSKP